MIGTTCMCPLGRNICQPKVSVSRGSTVRIQLFQGRLLDPNVKLTCKSEWQSGYLLEFGISVAKKLQ